MIPPNEVFLQNELRWVITLLELINIKITKLEEKINHMADTQAELAQDLRDMKDREVKIQGEVQKLLDLIKSLQDQLAQGGPLTQEVKDANEALKVQVGVVDDLNEDTPPEDTPPEVATT